MVCAGPQTCDSRPGLGLHRSSSNGLRLSGARKGVRCSRGLGPLREFTFESFSQELLEQRLIRNIAFVRQDLEMADHRLRQPQRDGAERGTKVRKGATPSGSPVDVVRRVSLSPKGTLFLLGTENRDLLT